MAGVPLNINFIDTLKSCYFADYSQYVKPADDKDLFAKFAQAILEKNPDNIKEYYDCTIGGDVRVFPAIGADMPVFNVHFSNRSHFEKLKSVVNKCLFSLRNDLVTVDNPFETVVHFQEKQVVFTLSDMRGKPIPPGNKCYKIIGMQLSEPPLEGLAAAGAGAINLIETTAAVVGVVIDKIVDAGKALGTGAAVVAHKVGVVNP